jgi:hypothetical protein
MGAAWLHFHRQRIAGVTILGDVLRPNPEGQPGGVDGQAAWLHLAVRRQVEAACGKAPTLLSAVECPALRDWVAAQRTPSDAAAYWAARHDWVSPFGSLRDLLEPRLAGQFCVGYELPPYLSRLLDTMGLPYLDLRLHPVRFLDDLLFAARASDPRVAAGLAAWAVPRDLASDGAGLHEAAARLHPRSARDPGALLVVGQRLNDATQIADGAFFDAAARRAEIQHLCTASSAVLAKDHPCGERHSLVAEALASRPDARLARVGVYRLLADPSVGRVLTVNSSVAYEAPFFGKPVTTLLPLPAQIAWRGEPATPGTHVTVGDAFLATDFWRDALAPYARVSPHDGRRLAPKPNRLRVALDVAWGHERTNQPAPHLDRAPLAWLTNPLSAASSAMAEPGG